MKIKKKLSKSQILCKKNLFDFLLVLVHLFFSSFNLTYSRFKWVRDNCKCRYWGECARGRQRRPRLGKKRSTEAAAEGARGKLIHSLASSSRLETFINSKSYFTTTYFRGPLYVDFQLSPTYEFVLSWHDVDRDPWPLYITCDRNAHKWPVVGSNKIIWKPWHSGTKVSQWLISLGYRLWALVADPLMGHNVCALSFSHPRTNQSQRANLSN